MQISWNLQSGDTDRLIRRPHDDDGTWSRQQLVVVSHCLETIIIYVHLNESEEETKKKSKTQRRSEKEMGIIRRVVIRYQCQFEQITLQRTLQ